MQTSDRVRRGFNRLSPIYDTAAGLFFGKQLMRAQNFWIGKTEPAEHILVFGGGTGKIIREIEACHRPLKVCYVDISDKMNGAAKRLVEEEFPDRLTAYEFICGSWTDLPVEKTFQLIITPFVLDCLTDEDLPAAVEALRDRLSPSGAWLFTDFHVPRTRFMAFAGNLVVGFLYAFFQLSCGLQRNRLADFSGVFASAGLREEEECFFCNGLLTSRIYRLQ